MDLEKIKLQLREFSKKVIPKKFIALVKIQKMHVQKLN